MSFSTDKYLAREYRRGTYDCWSMAKDVWLELTGVDLRHLVPSGDTKADYESHTLEAASTLRRVDDLQDPCLVLMQRKRLEPHVGVFYKGKLLHLNTHGAQYRPLEQITVPYPTVTYYTNVDSSLSK